MSENFNYFVFYYVIILYIFSVQQSTIGVDYKAKIIKLDDKDVKLQVNFKIWSNGLFILTRYGIQQVKKGLEQ